MAIHAVQAPQHPASTFPILQGDEMSAVSNVAQHEYCVTNVCRPCTLMRYVARRQQLGAIVCAGSHRQ